MALATFLQLAMDAADPARLASFWSTVLGWDPEVRDDRAAIRLTGTDAGEALWVERVPEPRAVKHRVHLDLSVGSLQPLLAAGATVLLPAQDSGFPWTVLADPEGGEFCAFVREDRDPDDPAGLFEVVVDVADDGVSSRAAADWWADVLGGSSVDDGRGFWWVADVETLPLETMDMIPVPEPKTAKNRIHWDVTCDDVPAVVARGATVLRTPDDDIHRHVLADPWGNEFCVFGS